LIGKTLNHYRIVERIGAGGMGEVYRARDTRLDRDVALKLLPVSASDDPELIGRLEQEARTVASLHHPNIVTLYSLEEADGVRFLTMEMVEGKTLSEGILDGAPHPDKVCVFLLPLVDALATAHASGVVHRDLKPSNVMLTDDGMVMLLDFGVARMAEAGGFDQELRTQMATDPGARMGTPSYMSPEQVRGARVDARSDIFSLGILMHELATGEHPFIASSPAETMTAILRDDPPPCGTPGDAASQRLNSILQRCLEKDPGARYADASELRADLHALQALEDGESKGDVSTELERGRSAFERRDWASAHEHLTRTDQSAPLEADDLERLMTAGLWSGHLSESLRNCERTYAALLKAGRTERAGMTAILLESLYHHRDAPAVARGWQKQAERLLNLPGTRGYGHLVRMWARQTIESKGDLDRAQGWAGEVLELGRRLDDAELEALGLLDLGRIRVQRGDVESGFGLIDEAMALASGADVDPAIIGSIYCSMLASCQMVADFKRAGEWSDAALVWCDATGDSGFPGICRVHRADVFRRRGRWEEAETLARRAHDHMTGFLNDVAAEAQYEIGEIHLARGEFDSAEEAFRAAHEQGRNPLPGMARLRLAQGKADAARSLLHRTLAETDHPLERAPLLPAWIETNLRTGDHAEAASTVEELDGIATRFASRTYAADTSHARGLCRLEDGDAEAAIPHLRKALRARKALDLPPEGARTRLALGRAYRAVGDEENAALELGTALSTFRKLGAEPAAREAEQLLAELS